MASSGEPAGDAEPAPGRRPREARTQEPEDSWNPWVLSPADGDGDTPSGGEDAEAPEPVAAPPRRAATGRAQPSAAGRAAKVKPKVTETEKTVAPEKPTAARAARKDTAEEKAASDPGEAPKQDAEPGDIPVESLFNGIASLLGDGVATVVDSNAFPFSSSQGPGKRIKDDHAKEIAVEHLANGVVTVLGDGVAVAVDTSLLAASKMRDSAKRAVLACLVSFCETVGELTDQEFCKKADTDDAS